MKRKILFLILICMIAACTPVAPTTNPVSSGESRDGIMLMLSESPEGILGYQKIIDAFARVQPDIKITINNIPDKGKFMERLAADFAAQTPPDVFVINYRRFGQFALKGALEPMDVYIAEGKVIQLGDFYPVALDAFKFNGKQYCLPQNLSSLEVYYNKNLFTAANIPFPNNTWTWNEFLVAARALTKSSNGKVAQYGLGIDPVILRLAPFIWAHGGDIVDDPDNPTRLTLDAPLSREAFQWFVDLQVKEQVVPSQTDEATESSQSRFERGTLGMFLQSRSITTELRETIKDFEWDVAPLPRDNYVATVLHSDGYCITSGSKNKPQAWLFIEFANGIEGQKTMVTSGRTVPSLVSVAESPLFLDSNLLPAGSRVYLDMAPNIRRVPVMTTWVEVEDVINQEINRAFYGEISVDEAISIAMSQTREFFLQNQTEASP